MVRVRRHHGVTLKVGVASHAHPIRLVPEFHGRRIRGRAVAVRIVAGSAAQLSFPETLRALECFRNERRLAKSAILVETLAREISKRNPQMLAAELHGPSAIQV